MSPADGAMALEARDGIGGNSPPELTPFDACRIHIEDLMLEAKNWCDGAAVENQAQADVVSKLMEDFRLAHVAADEARKKENEDFDKGKAAVQLKYAPLIADTKAVRGKAVLAQEALKASLKPFLDAEAAKQRKALEEAQAAAQKLADEAAAALRAAPVENLEAREEAEDLVDAARRASATVRQVEAAKPQARGGSRALGLKATFTATVTDKRAAILHYMAVNPEAFVELVLKLAQTDVDAGKRTIPGITVVEGTRL